MLAAVLTAGALPGAGTGLSGMARAQDLSGAPIAMGDPAGNGTHDGGSAQPAGEGAAPLSAPGDAPAPFDIRSTRHRLDTVLAMPAYPQDHPAAAANQPARPTSTGSATANPPVPGFGAPSLGTGTPGTGTPTASTPASGAPAAATAPQQGLMVSRYLSELIGSQLRRFVVSPKEAQALADFYAARQYQPVFTAAGGYSAIGSAVLGTFAASALEGLAPADYVVPPLRAHASDGELAEAELRLAATTLLYARHVQSGRFDPKGINPEFVDPTPTAPEAAAVLALVATSPNTSAVMASFAPQYDEYRLLKMQLATRLADGRGVPLAQVPPGPTLRPGDGDRRVPLLRARLGLQGAPDDFGYDDMLVDAVRQFQAASGQKPDGLVGPGTLAALNGTGSESLPDIIANMERWRWVPHEVAPVYVMVNIPEFMVRVVVNEQTIHETRVVVGTEKNQTPIMSAEMQYMVFNPSWNLPPGIIRNEMLPKLQADPYALDRQGIDVVRNGRIIDPGTVDWSRGTQGYSFRQPPGERNALGNMKFMFPNKHSVYLHDTPSRALFGRERRAFSHGCVRVHEPMKFAEVMFGLGVNDQWDQKRISRLLGGNEKHVSLQRRFPVHLVYFTTYVDGAGKLVSREDIYGTNAAVKAILGLDGSSRIATRGRQTALR
ncbi:L,D-transpeptidase family protein [Ancylobacter sp. A5.8]|uniref:L,D-transpeptidase family protein n=1 Tax=Ancylobacter gelatini TaxID=2919920 RepID=UPI001F4DB0A8|nr:L,D-transpeptidase family protein [Ancylobacter gelatini]MCJ8144684.1 L,D-transpeptidase family protein [Ancylobacter gelatini]